MIYCNPLLMALVSSSSNSGGQLFLLAATGTRAQYLHSPGWGDSRASRVQKCWFALREASAMKEQLLGATSHAPLFEAVDVAPSPRAFLPHPCGMET